MIKDASWPSSNTVLKQIYKLNGLWKQTEHIDQKKKSTHTFVIENTFRELISSQIHIYIKQLGNSYPVKCNYPSIIWTVCPKDKQFSNTGIPPDIDRYSLTFQMLNSWHNSFKRFFKLLFMDSDSFSRCPDHVKNIITKCWSQLHG